MKNISTNKQTGAVSLFVVIFFMLIITVITVSFLRLMVNDQRQASDNDLSQSAYDSATTGVEDAKRALLKYQKDCSVSPTSCGAYATAISSDICNSALNNLPGIGSISTPGNPVPEVKVQKTQSSADSDSALDQAYTCVTIKLKTEDYVGNLAVNESQLVPLIGDGAFDKVKIEWFSKSKNDVPTINGATPISLLSAASGQPLLDKENWPLNRPSIMRAQVIQFAGSFNLGTFDVYNGTTQANTSTMFLYPTSQTQAAVGEKVFMDIDPRKTTPTGDPVPKSATNNPSPVHCEPNLNSGDDWACSATMVLPQAIGGAADNSDRTAFLRLEALYNATHFKVSLINSSGTGSIVKFKDVQPSVDSTGRANDLFRRVVSRVNLYDTSFPYPEATIDVTGDFCKDYAVTNDQYVLGTTGCNP